MKSTDDLSKFFDDYDDLALAFSGGTDSSFLLDFAIRKKVNIKAFYVKSQFQPGFEYLDAIDFASSRNADMEIIEIDMLKHEDVSANPPDRCYLCKTVIFDTIRHYAEKQGYKTIIDGTNASDSEVDRPGMRALNELGILSPLRLCGMRKEDIRALSKDAGLPTWDVPSYSCLATRISANVRITGTDLKRVESSEMKLRSMGFRDVRVRIDNESAFIQFNKLDLDRARACIKSIEVALSDDFDSICIDPRARL